MRLSWVCFFVFFLVLFSTSYSDSNSHDLSAASLRDKDLSDEPSDQFHSANSVAEDNSNSAANNDVTYNSIDDVDSEDLDSSGQVLSSADDDDESGNPEDNEHVISLVSTAETAMRIERNGPRALHYFRAAGVLGHYGALTSAASLLISADINVKRDVSTAVRYLRIAANAGQEDAQAFLGMLCASGIAERYGVRKDMGKALLYWKFAARSYNTYAATALGYRYHAGIDVKADCKTAARNYLIAAKEVARDPNTWPSWRNFMYGLPPLPSKLKNPDRERISDDAVAGSEGHGSAGGGGGSSQNSNSEEDILHYYRHSAARGNADAQTTIGALQYFGGRGIPRNEATAEATLRRAAAAGSGDANAMLAHIRMRRNDPPESVLELFERAASLGNRHGHYGLGMVYLYGLLDKSKDYPLAMQHFQLAMDQRHAEAAFHLGRMHSKALGVEKSRLEAFRHFQHGARLGNVQCEYALGVYFMDGLGPVKKPDCVSAVPYLKRVAEKGNWREVFDNGMSAFSSGDTFGALWRFQQAAQAGIELGQYNAAILLENARQGNITEIEHWDRARLIDESRSLYHMSAGEFPPAWVRSGNMAFLEKKDYKGAAWSYEMGYKLKNAEATFCLAWMYVRGLGVPRDRHLALRYMDFAKNSNSEATVPVYVAIALLKMWWTLRDMTQRFGLDEFVGTRLDEITERFWKWADNAELYRRNAGKLRALDSLGSVTKKENRDMVLVLGLLFVLLFVVTLRKRRLQLDEEVDDESGQAQ